MKEECIICKAPLVYTPRERMMECVLCHKQERSRTCCTQEHYVCDDCHTRGIDSITGLCLAETARDPIVLLEKLMALPFCHMHGPEHHVLVGAALLTACRNAGAGVDLPRALEELQSRARQVPGGACGFWGACGAAVSCGMAVSILTGATPLAEEAWGLSNQMTACALERIGAVGGPRCCKRDSYLALSAAVPFLREHLGVELSLSPVHCRRSPQNNQCLGQRCPFFTPQPEA